MTRKKMTPTARRNERATVNLEIELPVLSDEAAAAMADVLVQLYHRFEATYYAQILSHHADRALSIDLNCPGRSNPHPGADPF
jgi:hypothetical protein